MLFTIFAEPLSYLVRSLHVSVLVLLVSIISFVSVRARASPVDFTLASQTADAALLAFSKQANVEVLFPFDELNKVRSTVVIGRYEPEDALRRLLSGTGFIGRRSAKGKFSVSLAPPADGSIRGQLLDPDGLPAPGLRIKILNMRQSVATDAKGTFEFASVPPGVHRLIATGGAYQPLLIADVHVESARVLILGPKRMQTGNEPMQLERVVVEAPSGQPQLFDRMSGLPRPRTATGNLDLIRTKNDALPYTIFDRDQITRSGMVNLNDFLRRELLNSDASTSPPEENGSADSFRVGSTNLNLRGYGSDATVVLVNGRRLPEVLTSAPERSLPGSGVVPLPDVNFIPLSLVQEVQVLSASASALYSGNPVGGVINIVLRPEADANATEVTATYSNALRRFDAPQSTASLLHGESLLAGTLHVRVNANLTRTMPATEAELGFHRAHPPSNATDNNIFYRATPTVRSATQDPLFGPGTTTITSVAPGADGTGGLSLFSQRPSGPNLDFFDSPGGLAASVNSVDYPYGRRQRRETYYGSVSYDLFPWLQLGLDGTYGRTVVNRGYDVLVADLNLKAVSPLNPFKQDILVSLNETAPFLGENFNEARLEFASVVLGALLKLPDEWRVSLDAQYAHNLTKYRGLAGADPVRWQQLVDAGIYNPLRDTQVYGPPKEFYEQVLIYRGGRGRFVTLGDYKTLDAAIRATKTSLRLPTGPATVNLGADYRRNELKKFRDESRFADGSLAGAPTDFSGRSLGRYSVFGELQAPLLPKRRLPHWLRKVETDLAVRYIAADTSRETNVAPTYGLKLDFPGGFSLRGSFSTSSRYPTPYVSRQVTSIPATLGSGSGVDATPIFDPLRHNQNYSVQASEAVNPVLLPDEAITQTAGLIFQRGKLHSFRFSLDFADTRKTNEQQILEAQTAVNLEPIFPERVKREPKAFDDPESVGRISSVTTGVVNAAWRHSQDWNVAMDYAWTEFLGGTLSLRGRLVYFQRYDLQLFPTTPIVDELRGPDGLTSGLLRYRANFGAAWSDRNFGFGLEGHYFHSRILPKVEQPIQGSDHIDPFWQFDAYLQADLKRWLPWKSSRYGLRMQVRVDNLFRAEFPRYASASSGAGVQSYGDWRGQVYSLSLTATF